MKKYLMSLFLSLSIFGCANSLNLANNSVYTLKAIVYDATGEVLGEFILNPRDGAEWSDDQMFYGTDMQDASQTPYSVDWFCMGGGAYGTCTNVAAGSLVTAQSCGGTQECHAEEDNHE